MGDFKPAFGLGNPHLQTIYSTLFRKLPKLQFEIEKFTLNDGDFLECYWLTKNKLQTNKAIVILFHGLAGSYESPYIQGMMIELQKSGFIPVLMHFRGCNGNDNLLPRSYHSGESGDALEYIQHLKKTYPDSKLYAIGYSLGANMLLKLLGEVEKNSLLEKAVAISPPMQLDICADRMNRGFSRYYQYRLVQDLNKALQKKYVRHHMQKLISLRYEDIKKLKTFWEFDGRYTAPIHGFTSAKDYYIKCSSRQFLKNIRTPTLIIHSKDDPFMTPEVIPTQEELSSSITIELTKKGGHVGFVGGKFLCVEYWLEKRIISFLKD